MALGNWISNAVGNGPTFLQLFEVICMHMHTLHGKMGMHVQTKVSQEGPG